MRFAGPVVVALSISVMLPAVAAAQAVPPTDEIVVTARRTGLPFWKVTGPTTTILLLPSDGAIPAEADGSLAALADTLRQADQLLYPGRTSISLSPFKMFGYYMRWRKMSSLPKGTTLASLVLPRDMARLDTLRQRGLLKEGFERKHPFPLSVELKRAAFGEPKSGASVIQFVERIAKEHGIRRVPPTAIASKPVVNAFYQTDPKAYLPCLGATVDLGEAGPAARAQHSRAWRERRVKDVLASPVSRAFELCIPPALREIDRPDVRAEVRSLMNQPRVTIAVLPLASLAQPSGILDDLSAAGYDVSGPAWN